MKKVKSIKSWIEKNQRKIIRKIRLYSFLYYFSSIITLVSQITILVLSAVGIHILATTDKSGSTAVILTSLSAAVIFVIFIFNIVNIIYKTKMRWPIYKDIMDYIQVEYMKYYYKQDSYKNCKDPKKMLKKSIEKYIESTVVTKDKLKLNKVFSKALEKGINA